MGAMDLWSVLFDVLILLLTALVLGVVCERLRQSPILGYLAAGTLLGPNALQFISSASEVSALAELGVALLLFTIGLEFSWHRLRRLGAAALGGGTAQVIVTMGLGTATALFFGMSWRTALAIGAIVALSSTTIVLRLLVSRAEIESIHGRHALGILLIQDVAVVPLAYGANIRPNCKSSVSQCERRVDLHALRPTATLWQCMMCSGHSS